MSLPPVDPSEVLLRARRSWSPQAGDAARVRRALDRSLAAGAASASAARTVDAPAWPARVLLATAFAVVTAGGGYWAGRRAALTHVDPPAAVAPPVISSRTAPPPEIARPIHPTVEVPSFVPTPREARGDRRKTERPPQREGSSLATELRALRNAERALRDDKPGLALAFLHDLDRQVPDGELREERAAAATLARCARGEKAFDVDLAGQFTARYPTSVYRARVEQTCAGTDPAASGDSPGRRTQQ